MPKILLIGGTHGGETVDIEDGRRELRLPARPVGFQQTIGGAPQDEECVAGELVDANGGRHMVFIRRGEDPILALLSHYQNGR